MSDLDLLFEPADDGLEDLLVEATALAVENDRVKKARQRMANGQADAGMIELVRRYDEARQYTAVAAVALIHTQECAGCGGHQEFFMGWFEKKQHTTDKHTHKLIRGKPADVSLPMIVERHPQGVVECCPACVESSITIELAIRAAGAPEPPRSVREE